MSAAPIKVLIVDDSLLVREVARKQLAAQPDIRVLATAADPIEAMAQMARAWPDVIVLDVKMPRMDGITFLKKIMAEHPTPVVICSTVVGKGAQAGIEALAAGAVSLISKPQVGVSKFFEDECDNLVAAVRAAAQTNLARLRLIASRPPPVPLADKPPRMACAADARLIALGASTGGTQALETILGTLPSGLPGIVIVQHMPVGFSKKFADRLNLDLRLELREATHGQRVEPGLALIAQSGKHMCVRKNGAGYCVEVVDGPFLNRFRPSVDYLFSSVARAAGAHAFGAILTGMGDDGALGLKEMCDAGAHTVAESEETCVVFGMPKMAIQRGGVREVLPLDRIAERIKAWAR